MSLWRDLLYSLRLFSRKPGFVFLAIFTISLALSTVIITSSIVYHTALKPISFDGKNDLQIISQQDSAGYQWWSRFDGYSYNYIKNNTSSMDVLGSVSSGNHRIAFNGGVLIADGSAITPSLLVQADTKPLLGSLFTGTDDEVVIGYSLWQSFFAGDPDIVGINIDVDGSLRTIVGVMPEGFRFPLFADFWIPLTIAESVQPGEYSNLRPLVATFKQGLDRGAANLDLERLWVELSERYPDYYSNELSATILPYALLVTGEDVLDLILVMAITVLFILMFCCINVGSLLLVQVGERQREMAIRSAVGASRWHIVRQVLMESFLLCLCGLAIALLFSAFLLELFDNYHELFSEFIFGGVPFWWTIELDGASIFSAVFATASLWILCSFIPVSRVVNGEFNDVIGGGENSKFSVLGKNATKALIFSQLTFSCVLLIVAGSLALVINSITRTDYAANKERLLYAITMLDSSRYSDSNEINSYQEALQAKLLLNPGITNVSFARTFPGQGTPMIDYDLLTDSQLRNDQLPRVSIVRIDPMYLDTVGVSLLSGRNFSFDDNRASQGVAIVDENFANRHWPDESPLGKQILRTPNSNGELLTIVGVIPHIVQSDPWSDRGNEGVIYQPVAQSTFSSTNHTVLMRVKDEPENYIDFFRSSVQELDRNNPVLLAKPVVQLQREGVANYAWVGDFFVLVAAATIILAITGFLAIFSRTIFQRTREIGVRRAVGGDNRSILGLVIREGLTLLIPASFLGVLLAILISFRLVDYMPGIQNFLLFTIPATLTLAALVVFASSLLPTYKSIAIEPGEALRYE